MNNDLKYIKGENKEFKSYFKAIGDILGYKTTSTDQLDGVGFKLLGKKYKGAWAYDLTPNLKNGECCILNTDSSKGQGIHWVALYRDTKTVFFFYDSFGRDVSRTIPNLKKYLPKNCNIVSTQTVRQWGLSEYCGVSSLAWLYYIYQQPRASMALVI